MRRNSFLRMDKAAKNSVAAAAVVAVESTSLSVHAMAATFTKHAMERSQGRGLPPLAIDLLQQYGEEKPLPDGGLIVYWTRRARQRLEKAIGHGMYVRLGNFLDGYLIERRGRVITVGHHYAHIKTA